MAKNLLKAGDVIKLEKGMNVYANMPDKFIYRNRTFSDNISHVKITIGKKYVRTPETLETVEKEVEKALATLGISNVEEQIRRFVKSLNLDMSVEEYDTSVFEGEYVVARTTNEGGGTFACASGKDSYPNGYHVFCQKMDNKDIVVDFYQTGNFTAMIEDIMPINKKAKVLYISSQYQLRDLLTFFNAGCFEYNPNELTKEKANEFYSMMQDKTSMVIEWINVKETRKMHLIDEQLGICLLAFCKYHMDFMKSIKVRDEILNFPIYLKQNISSANKED